MIATILTTITALLGIIGTVIAYRYSPQRRVDRINAGLADIAAERRKLEQERDKAIYENDSDVLTRVADTFVRLRVREDVLLQQRREGGLGNG